MTPKGLSTRLPFGAEVFVRCVRAAFDMSHDGKSVGVQNLYKNDERLGRRLRSTHRRCGQGKRCTIQPRWTRCNDGGNQEREDRRFSLAAIDLGKESLLLSTRIDYEASPSSSADEFPFSCLHCGSDVARAWAYGLCHS